MSQEPKPKLPSQTTLVLFITMNCHQHERHHLKSETWESPLPLSLPLTFVSNPHQDSAPGIYLRPVDFSPNCWPALVPI